ncbi:hypothetical protein F2Q68_00006106 [Brassica cretica]|uniref:Uncharacterized protein n=1 Tax=Brassica cretica TaxID=69181 RepID=A0A8S9JIK9_BRACR|nr:hypothetical protein F2Q68_00006106 [Brassica cretica]
MNQPIETTSLYQARKYPSQHESSHKERGKVAETSHREWIDMGEPLGIGLVQDTPGTFHRFKNVSW